MDKCLEKKIYDRQVKKQGMSNRVVDECNPDAHLSMKDVTNLCYDYDNDLKQSNTEFSKAIDSYPDIIIQKMLSELKDALSKEPFFHESLLVDRKEKKLSLAEKRQAQRSYEMEKKASKQVFSYQTNKLQCRIFRNDGSIITRPVASVRPMQTSKPFIKASPIRSTRWIPAEVWQRQGMTAQEMTLPLDVVIPTNSSDKTNIILKSGQRVMVLKSPKGIYMQLESGKIIAIRTSSKINQPAKPEKDNVIDITTDSNALSNKMCSTRDNKDSNSVNTSIAAATNTKEIDTRPLSKNLTTAKKEKHKLVLNEGKELSIDLKSDIAQTHSQKAQKRVLIPKKSISCQDSNYSKSTAKKTNSDCNQSTTVTEININNAANDILSDASKISLSSEKLRGVEMHTSIISGEQLDNFQSRDISATNDQFCENKTEKFNNDTQDESKLLYHLQKDTSQNLSNQDTPILNQNNSHQSITSQQKDPYASGYDLPRLNYSNDVPCNAYATNQEAFHHTQFYDPMYDNGVTLPYEHSNRFPSLSSNGAYGGFQQHFHPHFHNLGGMQNHSISAHPYYMRWPQMSTIAHPSNQQSPMHSSSFPQNDSSYQWHN